MTRHETLYHEAAMLPLAVEADQEKRRLLYGALYRIEVVLGLRPLPASESDLAANAEYEKTKEREHESV